MSRSTYADRKVKINELRIALRNAGPPARGYGGSDHRALDRFLAEHAVLCNAASNAMLVSEYALEAALHRGREKEDQRVLLREIFGNPFQPVRIRKEWLTATVVALARGIYDERAFDRMPILADALQDAGCDNDDILDHLRDANAPHVRGCWGSDLVLGKE